MKPFDLVRALAGAALATDAGEPVDRIIYNARGSSEQSIVIITADGVVYTGEIDARFT